MNLNKNMDKKQIQKLFIFLIIPFFCSSQNEPIQSIGSAITYVVTCPCKLFKYYENGGLVYFCEDAEHNIQYKIIEKKYKDLMDRLLNILDQNLYGSYKYASDSIISINRNHIIQDYLSRNPIGAQIDFMNSTAILVNEDGLQKLFFVAEENIVSFDIIVSGKDNRIVEDRFHQLINSLMIKRKNFKKIF